MSYVEDTLYERHEQLKKEHERLLKILCAVVYQSPGKVVAVNPYFIHEPVVFADELPDGVIELRATSKRVRECS